MSHRNIWRSLLLALVLIVGIAPVAAQDDATLIVFAAASLTDAFEELAVTFEAANPGVDVLFNFAGSSDLAAQLNAGAPADVFASANNRQMQVAQEGERIGAAPRTFVKNRLVLIVPSDNPANISGLSDLANEGILLVLAAPAVPVRDYTNTMLDRLAADPNYGESYREAFMANVVSEEENVRAVAAKVALGEADAGIVYISDVTPDISGNVIALPIPDALNTIATYPIAITDDTANPELAQAFVDYVLSEEGQATLGAWNFVPARIPELPNTVTLAEDGAFSIDGQVLNPLTLTVEDLQANFTAQTVDVTYLSGDGETSASFTGVLLWDVINAAQPNFNVDVRNDKASTYLVVSATDNYQAVVSWGEIDPDYAHQPILLAFEQDGEALALPRLVVPTDTRGSRYVSDVANISLRDAPTVSR